MALYILLTILGLLFGGIPLLSSIFDPASMVFNFPFIIFGVMIFGLGLIGFLNVSSVDKYGTDTYGIILDIVPSCVTVNHIPLMNAIVGYVNGHTVQEFTAAITSTQSTRLKVGQYASVKTYNNQGRINEIIRNDTSVPNMAKELLLAYLQQHGNLTDLEKSALSNILVQRNNDSQKEQKIEEPKSRICNNCGALIHTNECEYCGFIH